MFLFCCLRLCATLCKLGCFLFGRVFLVHTHTHTKNVLQPKGWQIQLNQSSHSVRLGWFIYDKEKVEDDLVSFLLYSIDLSLCVTFWGDAFCFAFFFGCQITPSEDLYKRVNYWLVTSPIGCTNANLISKLSKAPLNSPCKSRSHPTTFESSSLFLSW